MMSAVVFPAKFQKNKLVGVSCIRTYVHVQRPSSQPALRCSYETQRGYGGWICGNMLIQRRTTPFLRHFQRA